MKKNKGEWAESAVLFLILADGKIPVVYLSKTPNEEGVRLLVRSEASLSVADVLIERGHRIRYSLLRSEDFKPTGIRIFEDDEPVAEFDADTVKKDAAELIKAVREACMNAAERTFEVPEAERILQKYRAGSGKTKSTLKQDAELSLYDTDRVPLPPKGFSVKSYVGGRPTLFNASAGAKFSYRIAGTKSDLAEKLYKDATTPKGRSWVGDVFSAFEKAGVFTDTVKIRNPRFARNLNLLDSQMGEILGIMMRHAFASGERRFNSGLERLIEADPLEYGSDARVFYSYRIRHFLRSAALGFTASRPWDGSEGAEGGMIILSDKWDITCFNSGKSEFEDFLLDSTSFDTPSTGRNELGNLYRDEDTGSLYIDMGIQVREVNPFTGK